MKTMTPLLILSSSASGESLALRSTSALSFARAERIRP